MEMDFASKGVAGTGLGLGIAGTALGLLNGGLGNLGGIFGGGNAVCHENMPVNRYEAAQAAKIAELETEVKLRDAATYTDSKLLDLYKYVDGKISCIEGQMAQQAVYNATNTATIGCISNQVAQLMSLTKTVIPAANICPAPMEKFNSWTAPTTTTTAP
jgi:hypothetical protein